MISKDDFKERKHLRGKWCERQRYIGENKWLQDGKEKVLEDGKKKKEKK